ncbi:MAG: hypothetical protein Q7J12_07875, partial [Syntrophales bacterium]|nr:hypothetical protein [Syntrophales bacterium]
MQKESGASRWCLWVTGWFYDDGKDVIEICRVAAYLNKTVDVTSLQISLKSHRGNALMRQRRDMSPVFFHLLHHRGVF